MKLVRTVISVSAALALTVLAGCAADTNEPEPTDEKQENMPKVETGTLAPQCLMKYIPSNCGVAVCEVRDPIRRWCCSWSCID